MYGACCHALSVDVQNAIGELVSVYVQADLVHRAGLCTSGYGVGRDHPSQRKHPEGIRPKVCSMVSGVAKVREARPLSGKHLRRQLRDWRQVSLQVGHLLPFRAGEADGVSAITGSPSCGVWRMRPR
jgi:hypothetical protein